MKRAAGHDHDAAGGDGPVFHPLHVYGHPAFEHGERFVRIGVDVQRRRFALGHPDFKQQQRAVGPGAGGLEGQDTAVIEEEDLTLARGECDRSSAHSRSISVEGS